MPDEQIDDKENENSASESENNEEENKSGQTAEDEGTDNSNEDGEKQEGDDNQDPYEKKLAELENQNRRKGAALSEKNKKIHNLEAKLAEKGYDADEIKLIIEETLSEKLGDIDEKSKRLEEALKTATETNVNRAISDVSDNKGEAKIIRHFFDNEVNKNLSFEKQIDQAKILAKNVLNDDKFQKEIEKANQSTIKTTGKNRDYASIPQDVLDMANKLFKTKEGRQEFLNNYSKK